MISTGCGGARRNRTDDLFNAIEALSQLSYGPVFQNLVIAASIGAKRAFISPARGYNRKPSPATRAGGRKKRRAPVSDVQVSSSGAMSPSMRLLTSSSSSSSSSRNGSSGASSSASSTSMSSAAGSAAFSSPASTSPSDTMSTPAGAGSSVSSSSGLAVGRARAAAP